MKKLAALLCAAALASEAYGISVTNISNEGAWPAGRTELQKVITALSNQLSGTFSVGTVSVSNITQSGLTTLSSTSVSSTNTQILTLANPAVYLSLTDAATGTNTLSAPGTDGLNVIIVNVGTNSVVVPDSGAAALSGNTTLGQWDTLSLRAVIGSATQWVETSQTDN